MTWPMPMDPTAGTCERCVVGGGGFGIITVMIAFKNLTCRLV